MDPSHFTSSAVGTSRSILRLVVSRRSLRALFLLLLLAGGSFAAVDRSGAALAATAGPKILLDTYLMQSYCYDGGGERYCTRLSEPVSAHRVNGKGFVPYALVTVRVVQNVSFAVLGEWTVSASATGAFTLKTDVEIASAPADPAYDVVIFEAVDWFTGKSATATGFTS